MNQEAVPLKDRVLSALQEVIDPETGIDVVRMRLIENLEAEPDGRVRYTFHPSSPFCPMAVYLALQIKTAVKMVPGVVDQEIAVEGYIEQEKLTQLINKEDQ
ncbi:MAG: DUF59 domain-containing protein [Anaerolineales bacterium]|nr:DUF59 domain-containing protein [Anaerolineales bacterium]